MSLLRQILKISLSVFLVIYMFREDVTGMVTVGFPLVLLYVDNQ